MTGGSFKFCPPYIFGNGIRFDFMRLFIALSCKKINDLGYIPFDCVEKTKRFYENFKRAFEKEEREKEIRERIKCVKNYYNKETCLF